MKTYPFDLFKGGDSRTVKNSGEEAIARKDGYCEPYRHQDYPKHLYMGGKREVNQTTFEEVNTVSCIVQNADEEKAARAAGYRTLGEKEPVVEEEKPAKVKKAA